MPQVEQNYIDTGKVRYIYRPIVPDIGKDNAGRLAAESIYCAGEQGKFWEMTEWLYTNLDKWEAADDTIAFLKEQAAPQVGVDGTELESCLRTERFRSRLLAVKDDATARNIYSTPTFLINGKAYIGFKSYDEFSALIEEALKK